ncbi:SDR family oxidoreductase [uncultured Kiloniella sp.]|uniref:SDR family oxidoreductase n=1 Tax=uncultured Kiloniella sp. TaxID=1133091 RepID=UPI00260AC4B1|nr:SDR family oxidoreductase [uncultured Kiloniella sp.]
MSKLENRVAIITGASSGIGYAAAKLFAEEGAKVVVGARRQQELDKLIEEIRVAGGQGIAVAGDVTDESYAEALVEVATGTYGKLDIAFNNAGTLGTMGDTPTLTLDGWHETINTNLTSAFLSAKHQIPALLESDHGSLIFTSTFVGHTIGMPGMAPYAASKAGINGMMQCLAAEYGPKGLRVNSLIPGGTDTPMGRSVASNEEMEKFVKSLHGLKRIADPKEIATAALFLASDDASFVTGTALMVEGGVSINKT